MKSASLIFSLILVYGCGSAPLSSTATDGGNSSVNSSAEAVDVESDNPETDETSNTASTTESLDESPSNGDTSPESEAASDENSDLTESGTQDDSSANDESTEEGGTPGASEQGLDESDSCSLQLRAEVRDQNGPCTTCSFGDYITVVGLIENPCVNDKNYQATKNCLVSEFVIMNLDSGSSSEYPMTCEGGSTVTPVASGGELSRTRPAGRLSDANYHLTVQFKDPDSTLVELYFTVQ